MTPTQIRAAFEKMQKLVDLGRWMERLRGSAQASDGEAAREVMAAARTKRRTLVDELLGAPEPYVGWARELGDAIEIAVSSTVEEGSESPLAACDRADALLAEVMAHLEGGS